MLMKHNVATNPSLFDEANLVGTILGLRSKQKIIAVLLE